VLQGESLFIADGQAAAFRPYISFINGLIQVFIRSNTTKHHKIFGRQRIPYNHLACKTMKTIKTACNWGNNSNDDLYDFAEGADSFACI